MKRNKLEQREVVFLSRAGIGFALQSICTVSYGCREGWKHATLYIICSAPDQYITQHTYRLPYVVLHACLVDGVWEKIRADDRKDGILTSLYQKLS